MKATKLAPLCDYDKPPDKETIQLLLEYGHILMEGGSLEDHHNPKYVNEAMSKLVQNSLEVKTRLNSNVPIWLFLGSPYQIVKGADALMFPYPLNADIPELMFEVQAKSYPLAYAMGYRRDQILDMAYVIKKGRAREVTKAKDVNKEMLGYYGEVTRRLFRMGYLEASKGKIVGLDEIKHFADSVGENVISVYGGGIKTGDDIRSLCGVVDIIVVGTAFEEEPSRVKEFRKIVDEHNRLIKRL